MCEAQQYLDIRSPVALALIGDADTQDVLQLLAQLTQAVLGCALLTRWLLENAQAHRFLIYGPRQLLHLAIELGGDLVHLPWVLRPWRRRRRSVAKDCSHLWPP